MCKLITRRRRGGGWEGRTRGLHGKDGRDSEYAGRGPPRLEEVLAPSTTRDQALLPAPISPAVFFLREENTPRARDSIYIIPKFSLFSSCPSVAIDIGSVPLDREYVN